MATRGEFAWATGALPRPSTDARARHVSSGRYSVPTVLGAGSLDAALAGCVGGAAPSWVH
jgi:hypothetical protein